MRAGGCTPERIALVMISNARPMVGADDNGGCEQAAAHPFQAGFRHPVAADKRQAQPFLRA
jgi:hypothetical protein